MAAIKGTTGRSTNCRDLGLSGPTLGEALESLLTNGLFLRLCRPMCGEAMLRRKLPINFPAAMPPKIGGIAATVFIRHHGKAQPFRTSAGKALKAPYTPTGRAQIENRKSK